MSRKCSLVVLAFIVQFAHSQWQGAPQWEEVVSKAHKDLLYRRSRAVTSYSDCPDSPGNVEPPDQCRDDERWGPCGCYEPPFWPFDPIEVFVDVGYVVGRSMEYFGGASGRKYVNFFLGVPYARIPMHERRFKVFEILFMSLTTFCYYVQAMLLLDITFRLNNLRSHNKNPNFIATRRSYGWLGRRNSTLESRLLQVATLCQKE